VLIGSTTDLQDSGAIDIPALFGPQFDRVSIYYSSPEYYTKCKHEEIKSATLQRRGKNTSEAVAKLSVKTDDFFPYSDCEHCFWTGYFTSRAGFKRLERVASSFLLGARQIESMLDYTGKLDPVQCQESFHELEDASGVSQHHDGVSGTAKQHVANDYSKRLQKGIDGVSTCTIRKIKRLLLGGNATDYLKDLSFCQLLNETKCDVSQVSLAASRLTSDANF
jgi:alpha-mannosidase